METEKFAALFNSTASDRELNSKNEEYFSSAAKVASQKAEVLCKNIEVRKITSNSSEAKVAKWTYTSKESDEAGS